jgi:aspartyl/asparaginyl-tRNA synthetase
MTVEGAVVETYNSGKAVFLNFQEDYQGHFKVVIFPDDWHKFPEPPEKLFFGRLVRVTGVIREYQGAPEIIVNEPSQIEIAVDTSCPPCPPCPTTVPTQPSVISTQPSAIPTQPLATSTPPSATPTPLVIQATPTSTKVVVSWQDAAQYYGQVVTIEGRVVKTYNSGKAIFLNFHEDYRTYFKAVIFPDDWHKFPEPPEKLFLGKLVRVTGLVKEYKGAPEIIVEEPTQMEIIGE